MNSNFLLNLIIIGGLAGARLSFAAADPYQEKCDQDSQSATQACTTASTLNGASGDVDSLLGENRETNQGLSSDDPSSRAKLDNASRYMNRRDNAANLAKLSQAKSDACMKAFVKCMSSCTVASSHMGGLAQVNQLLQNSGQAATFSQLSANDSQQSQTCSGYQSNARAASEQAQMLNQIANQNQTGVDKSASAIETNLTNSMAASPEIADVSASVKQTGYGSNLAHREGGQIDTSTGGSADVSRSIASSSPDENSSASQLQAAQVQGAVQTNVATGAQSGSAIDKRSAALSLAHGGGGRESVTSGGGRSKFMAWIKGKLGLASNEVKSSDSIPQKRLLAGLSRNGASVKLIDGITSAFGPSLFQKVSRQYQDQMPIFIQEIQGELNSASKR